MQTFSGSEAPCLKGLVTDQDLDAAELEFPGICEFYAAHIGRMRTFLELLAAYLDAGGHAAERH